MPHGSVALDPNLTVVNNESYENAFAPIDFTVEGNVTDVNGDL